MYLCVHMCIVMYLHMFKHMLSMCVWGMEEYLCGNYSFASLSLSRDGQVRLRRLPKLQLENSILHSFFLFIKGVQVKYSLAIFLFQIYGWPKSGSRERFTHLYICIYIYTHRCSHLVREIQLGQSDTGIHVMSSLKTEQWQVRICTVHVEVGEELKNGLKLTYTLCEQIQFFVFSCDTVSGFVHLDWHLQ